MKLLHYSKEPLTAVRDVEQRGKTMTGYKPDGLWFSVGDGEDGWRAWCEGEEFMLDKLQCCTELVLAPDANILHLKSYEELQAFTDRFGSVFAEQSVPLKHWMMHIDWVKVASLYDGIIIAPYSWDAGLQFMWYYGFDCSSGCIWRARAITELVSRDINPKTV